MAEINKEIIAAKLKEFYGLKLSDLPKISYEKGGKVEPEKFGFLLTVHEKKITRSIVEEIKADFISRGYNDYFDYIIYKYNDDSPADISVVVPAYEQPGLCEEATEILKEINNASLQKALATIALFHLGADRRSSKMFLAYPVCRYADENLIENLAVEAKKWKDKTITIEPTQKSTFADALIYSSCKAAAKAAKTFKVKEKYDALRK